MTYFMTLAVTAATLFQVQDTVRLDPITVTATRTPVSASMLTSSLTVLSGDELRERGYLNVADALREVPGVTLLQTGSYGGTTSLFLRGGESDYVQVLVDGVPVNQPGGAYNFAHLSTANVERIEILRGPGSVLYGSEATTGVIQIVTREGSGSPQYSAGVRGGTFGSVNVDADVAGGSESVGYAFSVNHFLTNGSYAFNSDYDNTVWSGRVHVRADPRTDVALGLRYRDSRFHFPTDGSGNLVDQNAFSTDRATSVSIDAGRWLSDAVELRLLLASNVTALGADDAPDDAADTLGFYSSRSLQDLRRQSVELRSDFHLRDGVIVSTGAQVERQEETSFNESMSEFGPSNGSTDEHRDTRAVYGQLVASSNNVSLTIGGRVDDNSAFGTFWTYRGGVGYRFSSGTRLRGSIGRSFKAPTFFENFATGFATGNPDLRPERSTALEAGVSQTFFRDRLDVAAVFYHQAFRDLIQFSFTESPNFRNVAEANASGMEVELTGQPAAWLRIGANYTYLDSEVRDAGFDAGEGATFVMGNRLLRRPTHTLNLSADFATSIGSFGAGVTYLGDRDDRDFAIFPATPVLLPSATTADLWGTATVLRATGSRPGVDATFRVENLFDERYETVIGFPARGRAIFVGGRIVGGS